LENTCGIKGYNSYGMSVSLLSQRLIETQEAITSLQHANLEINFTFLNEILLIEERCIK
jgi:hypothetical protein